MSAAGEGRVAAMRLPDAALLLILILGIVFRSQYLNLPMAEAHRWREITNADIARNFYERSMNFFQPQVNWGGAGHPIVGMEFPLMHWIAALLYFPFGEHAVIGRLISMAFSVGTIWAVFALGLLAVRDRQRPRRGVPDGHLPERHLLRPVLHLRHTDGLLLGGRGVRVGGVSRHAIAARRASPAPSARRSPSW